MLIEPTAPDTALVGRAAFPKGHRYLRAADELDSLFTDDPFVALFPTHGHTILQFAEGLSDRHAANAVLSRIAWMHEQHPELTESGFDASALNEFRARLIAGAAEAHDHCPPRACRAEAMPRAG
jgi:transposase